MEFVISGAWKDKIYREAVLEIASSKKYQVPNIALNLNVLFIWRPNKLYFFNKINFCYNNDIISNVISEEKYERTTEFPFPNKNKLSLRQE